MASNTQNRTKAVRVKGKNPKLLSVSEASSRLGISTWSLRARIWAGDLAFVRFPGCRKMFLDIRDLEKLIEDNKIYS